VIAGLRQQARAKSRVFCSRSRTIFGPEDGVAWDDVSIEPIAGLSPSPVTFMRLQTDSLHPSKRNP